MRLHDPLPIKHLLDEDLERPIYELRQRVRDELVAQFALWGVSRCPS